jgi:hypothetical protein
MNGSPLQGRRILITTIDWHGAVNSAIQRVETVITKPCLAPRRCFVSMSHS